MQDTGANLSSVAATVSLLVLIVVELASFARDETEELSELVGTPVLFRMDRLDWWPTLGRLVVIHGLNLAVLAVAAMLVLSVSNGVVRNALLIVVLLVGLTLPMLEVGEYQAIRQAGVFPRSLVYNALTVAVPVVLAFSPWYNPSGFLTVYLNHSMGDFVNPTQTQLQQTVSFAAGLATVFSIFIITLIRMEEELIRVNQDSSGHDSVGNSDGSSVAGSSSKTDEESDPGDQGWYP